MFSKHRLCRVRSARSPSNLFSLGDTRAMLAKYGSLMMAEMAAWVGQELKSNSPPDIS